MTRPRFEDLKRSVRLYARGKTSVAPVVKRLDVMVRIARRLGDTHRDAMCDLLNVEIRRVFRAVHPAPAALARWTRDNGDVIDASARVDIRPQS